MSAKMLAMGVVTGVVALWVYDKWVKGRI